MAINSSKITNWDIYKITSPSGRVYIGLTSVEKLRKNCYKYASCKQQPIIYRSILKYGWGNHEYSIIDSFVSTLDFANGKEMFWIRSYMSNIHKYPEQKGMNLNDGGGTNIGFLHSKESKIKMSANGSGYKWTKAAREKFSELKKGFNSYWPTEETKKKMSLASKGRKLSEETKKKLSESCKGRPSPNKGKLMSEEQKAKYFKPILVYSLDGVFVKECKSVLATVLEFGVSKNTVRGIASGFIKTPEKFIFKYKKHDTRIYS